jgi:hypothetical protein
VFSLQRAAGAVDILASLVPEGVSDKRLSKLVEVAQHPTKPWVAAIEPRGSGVVWNYETSEQVAELSLEVAQGLDDDADEGDGVEAVASVSSPTSSKSFLQLGSSSPTAVSYIKSSRKSTGLKMLFYDQEAIAATSQIPAPRSCFDEWLIVLAATGIVIYDLNHNSMVSRTDRTTSWEYYASRSSPLILLLGRSDGSRRKTCRSRHQAVPSCCLLVCSRWASKTARSAS